MAPIKSKGIFNLYLREERLQRQWSQQKVAEYIGTTTNNISRWELGQTSPSPYFRAKLCDLFGKQPQQLGLLIEKPQHTSPSAPDTSRIPLSTSYQHPSILYVPYPRNPFFVGREELLHHLHTMLHRESTMALTQSWAISGLGGIGKTQVALEYAYRYASEYRFIFWASAATQETLLADFVAIAEHLQLPERQEHDQKRAVRAVKHWLTAHHEWLFILDNADDVALVRDFLPMNGPGHLLLTSCAQALGSLAQRLDVKSMGMVEGTLLLLYRAKVLAPNASLDHALEADLAAAEAIVIEMDFLPLAIDQAGAYIEDVGCSLSTYLKLYQTHRRELLQRRGHLASDHPEPVATTWSLSFQQIEQANPAAAELLRLCAFLEPDTIPEEFFRKSRVCLTAVLQQAVTSELLLNDIFEILRKFSLVQRDPETRLLRIHRLVQAVLKDAMEENEQRQWAERVVYATNMVFPQRIEQATWASCRRFLSQAQACSRWIESFAFVSAEAASLLVQTARYLMDAALYEQAGPLLRRALHIREQILGPEHSLVADTLNTLGTLSILQDKL